MRLRPTQTVAAGVLTVAIAAVATGLATGQLTGHHTTARADSTAVDGTLLDTGLPVYGNPDTTSKSIGTTTTDFRPLCTSPGSGNIFVTVAGPSLPGLGYVAPPDLNRFTGLPKCDSVAGTITTTTVKSQADCPKYDFGCEQPKVDQQCLTAEEAAAQQAIAQAILEEKYQQLLFKALTDLAGQKGAGALAQWVADKQKSGNSTATPDDIGKLLQESALNPLDMAMAAAQALQQLDEDTHRYSVTTCTGGSTQDDNAPLDDVLQANDSTDAGNTNQGDDQSGQNSQQSNDPNSKWQAMLDRLPKWIKNKMGQKTVGMWMNAAKGKAEVMESGSDTVIPGLTAEAKTKRENAYARFAAWAEAKLKPLIGSASRATDVEQKLVAYMNLNKPPINELDVVINNPKGPCGGFADSCRSALPLLLEDGQTLTVHWKDDNGVWQEFPFTKKP